MSHYDQTRTPIFAALLNYVADQVLPFHVPGHKQGRGLPEFTAFVGTNVMAMDLTCLPELDNILNPRNVIAEAEALAAQVYGADQAFFLVNGTTCGIQAMIMSVCQPGDKIIIPRNAHKSALGGLILSGAQPVYIEPELNQDFGISMGVTPETLERALAQHPDAKAVFLINPNYYGTASNLPVLVELAHAYDMPVVVDEAHGAHLTFSAELPISAMEAGADLAACSIHKLAGSMTQSSLLLLKSGLLNPRRVKAVLNLAQTTSPSYILLASLDVARKQMALRGRELIATTVALARDARAKISRIDGLRLLDESLAGQPGCFALDVTKLVINVQKLGFSGYEMERILRQEYHLQVELSDLHNVLLLVTLGDSPETIGCMLEALAAVAATRPLHNVVKYCPPLPTIPRAAVLPREAFYGKTRLVDLQQAEGEISAEPVMAYPPGIPIVCPGERITREMIDYINVLKQEQAELQGTEDPEIRQIKVLEDVAVLPLDLELMDAEVS